MLPGDLGEKGWEMWVDRRWTGEMKMVKMGKMEFLIKM